MNRIENEIITDEEFDLICEYIKIRNNLKVSQRELSNITELAQSTISRLEKKLHSASLGTFIKILNALDCKLIIKNNKEIKNEKESIICFSISIIINSIYKCICQRISSI